MEDQDKFRVPKKQLINLPDLKVIPEGSQSPISPTLKDQRKLKSNVRRLSTL